MLTAGLVIEQVDGTTVVGWISVTNLSGLAEVDGVERVAPKVDPPVALDRGRRRAALDIMARLWN